MTIATVTTISFLLLLAGAAPGAAEAPAAPGTTLERDGYRITFAGFDRLTADQMRMRNSQGGFRVFWIAEARPGDKFPPGLGEVKLTFDGKQYNVVTNPTSSKPLAPDVIVHEPERLARERPSALRYRGPKPRPSAPVVVFEALIYGGALPAWKSGTAEIEIGLFAPGRTDQPQKWRGEWFRFALPPSMDRQP